jgi:deoxycytidine triphosphate deaminase
MSVLSDRDIIRELGRSILFHPLKPGSIKACDLCLTASEYAYAIGKKQRLTIETEPKKDKPDEEQKFFLIPPRDTVLVWTDESVWLSNQFRGPLYSVVDRVSNGLGHIGTRVNPCWSGVLCIALHNVSDEAVRINVRDVKQSIVYLAIEKLSSNSSSNSKPDNPARLDVLSEQPNRQEIDIYFNKKENSWMRGDTDRLKKLMLESDEYKKLKRGVHDTLLSLLGSDEQVRWTAISAIAALLAVIIAGIALFKPSPSSTPSPTKAPTPQIQANPNKTVNPTLDK